MKKPRPQATAVAKSEASFASKPSPETTSLRSQPLLPQSGGAWIRQKDGSLVPDEPVKEG